MKMVRLTFCLCLLLVSLIAVGLPGMAMAQDEEEPEPVLISEGEPEDEPEPELISEGEPEALEDVALLPNFPTVESIAGGEFVFEMEVLYVGPAPKVFDMRTTAPVGWEVHMTPKYEADKKISSIGLKPSFGAGETIRVVANAPFWPLPEPGEYPIIIEAVSDTISRSVELTAEITARYYLDTVPANEQYNTTTRAGDDNVFSIKVRNLGTAAIENVQFSSDKPDGWAIEFTPDKIDAIEAIDEQAVDINIKPPPKTVAGDYLISLRASGKQTVADEIDIRVTVETPTVWGWVGVAIIVIVVIGLSFVFMRFSRR